MDVPGIMGRTVDCCEQVFNLIKGKDLNDSTSIDCESELNKYGGEQDLSNLKIGIPIEYDDHEGDNCLSAEIRDVWKATADYLSDCGAKVEKVSLPHNQYSLFCYLVLNSCEVASNFRLEDYNFRTKF